MEPIGSKIWLVPGGHIPFHSNGKEPELLSQDRITILNTQPRDVEIQISLYYTDQEPTGPQKVIVSARRVRQIRINDIIEPYPVMLETDYALLIEADKPVVVQFTRMNTGQANLAIMGSMGYGEEE